MIDVLLVTHYTETPGVMDKMLAYLKRHGYSVSCILNPLNPKSSLKSVVKTSEKKIDYKIHWPLQYILEGLVSYIKWRASFSNTGYYDLAICFDPLSFTQTFFFRRLMKIHKIIYYNVDFSTKRFNNPILNQVYISVNKFAYQRCDYFFYLSENYTKAIDPECSYKKKSVLLSHTLDMHGVRKTVEKIPNSIVYAGSLAYSVDFTYLLDALEKIKKEGLAFIFDIYGEGIKRKELELRIRNSALIQNVKFMGIVENETLLTKVLPKYTIGVCPYIVEGSNVEANHMFTGTDLPTKLVEYIGTGLPVVTTRLYSAFDVVEKKEFGFLAKTAKDWQVYIKKLLLNNELRTRYAVNALTFAQKYDEENVLTPIFNKILPQRERN